MENNCLLEVINLKKYFEVKKGFFSKPLYIKAVDGVSFSLKRGETIALVGESGSGKTTLGKTILGIYSPTSGKIIFKGRDLSNLKPNELPLYRRKVQLIQQDPFGSIPYFFPIYRVLEEPLIVNKIGNREERRKLIYDALMSVRLLPVEDFYSKYPHMLSGGQLQRVAIARALVIEPELIVADEPVSMLDASVKVEVLALLRELQE
ncbi:MAG: dipeptide/oligopeptide/nickel ABC transporter ATP-binding protein, partial [Candidatus Bathyarchaeia archaeon]